MNAIVFTTSTFDNPRARRARIAERARVRRVRYVVCRTCGIERELGAGCGFPCA